MKCIQTVRTQSISTNSKRPLDIENGLLPMTQLSYLMHAFVGCLTSFLSLQKFQFPMSEDKYRITLFMTFCTEYSLVAQKWIFCKNLVTFVQKHSLIKIMHFLYDSCKSFLTKSFQETHFLQDPFRKYISCKMLVRYLLFARISPKIYNLEESFWNMQEQDGRLVLA